MQWHIVVRVLAEALRLVVCPLVGAGATVVAAAYDPAGVQRLAALLKSFVS